MRSLKSGLATIAVSGGFAVAAIVGCSAEGTSSDLEPTQEQAPTEDPGAVLPPSDATGAVDAGKAAAKDAGKPKADASGGPVDAGPPPPTPGTACTAVNTIATKACGKCGEAQALCQSSKTWSPYGPCEAESGECTPGETAACGNCGTKTCDGFCGWGACTGEPIDSCALGSSDQSTIGCPPQGTVKPYRTRSCKTDCTWADYSTTCFVPPSWNPVTVTLPTATKITRPGFSDLAPCPATALDGDATSYAYTQVTNPTAAPVKVTLYHSKATGGTVDMDTVLAVYAGATAPSTLAQRKVCIGRIGDQSSASADSALTGNTNFAIVKDITIPANGTITVYSAAWKTTDSGPITLNIKAQ
jgi:hypothetical protein